MSNGKEALDTKEHNAIVSYYWAFFFTVTIQ